VKDNQNNQHIFFINILNNYTQIHLYMNILGRTSRGKTYRSRNVRIPCRQPLSLWPMV